MSFFQKNKSIIVILVMVGFFIAILLTFISGITDSKSKPTPTESDVSQPSNLATSTLQVTPSNPQSTGATQVPDAPFGTLDPPPGVTESAVTEPAPPQELGSPPPTSKSSTTEAAPGTDAPPPPTVAGSLTDTGPLGTDFPPPLTVVPPATETPPPGNGPPPGS